MNAAAASTRRPPAWRGVGLAAAAIILAQAWPGGLSGQSGRSGEGIVAPAWMQSWQPLRPLAEPHAPDPLPAPPGATLLGAPPPRIGLFWTAGNPAGLPTDASGSWTRFAANRDVLDGEHRRPFDPIRQEVDRLEGASFGEVGGWGAAAGEVSFRRSLLAPHSFADVVEPYRGTPFVLTDTSQTDFRRVAARLDGALGVRLGKWMLGFGGGHHSIDNRTRESGLPRFGRRAAWAGTIGVSRELGGPFRAGLHARYRGEAESMAIRAEEEFGRVHILEGWSEPAPIELAPLSTPTLFRRMERRGLSVGAQLGADAFGGDWLLWGERGEADETQINTPQAEDDDPFDRWDTEDWRVGIAFLRLAGPFLLEADGRVSETTGVATQPDFQEPIFLASVSRLALRVGSRWSSRDAAWRTRLAVGATRERHERADRIVDLRSDLRLWTLWATGGAARTFGRLGVEAGYGLALREPAGSTPALNELGSVSSELVGVALGFDATRTVTHRAGVEGTWRTGARTALWAGVQYLRAVAGDPPPALGLDRRAHARDSWRLGFGVIIEDR